MELPAEEQEGTAVVIRVAFPEEPLLENTWYWLLFLAVAFILPRLPVVGKFFNIINTALHEFGHALVAL